MLEEYKYHTKIMGCDFDALFVAESVFVADRIFTEAIEIAKLYEKNFSRFDGESELSRVNREKNVNVSKEFLRVLSTACDLHKETLGRYNPLLQVEKIGYDRSFDKLNSHTLRDVKERSYNSDLNDLKIIDSQVFLDSEHKLDFGGFLKGYVAQKITKEIASENGMIINIGGDIFVCGSDCRGDKFIIEIEHPHDAQKNIKIPVKDKAICTSGTYKRKWFLGVEKVHHIIDGDTRKSVKSDIFSASVLHKNGAVADAFATCAIVMGSDDAQNFLKSRDVEFVLMCENGDILTSDIFK